MSHPVAPLRAATLISLSLAWSWAVVAASVGLNALIKSNQSQSHLKAAVPPPTVLTINVQDVFTTGVVATTGSTLISVLIFNFIAASLLPSTRAFAVRTLRLQALSLYFCCIWVFAALVPFTHFFATRRATVKAFVGKVELPQSLIQRLEASMGATSVYKEIDYLKLVAILPWIAIFFTAIAATVLLMASSRVQRTPATSGSDTSMVEKERVSHQEHA